MDVELAILAGRIDALLAQASGARSIAERRHALDALARGLLLADPGAVDRASLDAARALRVDPSTVAAASAPRPPHAVDAPLVAEGASLVRQVLVTYDPVGRASDGLLGVTARRWCALAIEQAARDAPAPREPSAHRLVPAQPAALAHARIDGPSLGAATYLSAVALFSSRRVAPDLVVTGAVQGEAVLGVGEVARKVEAAAARGARLLVPAADLAAARAHASAQGLPLTIVGAATTGELRALALEEGPRAAAPEQRLADAKRQFGGGWDGYRWPSIRESLTRLSATLPEGRVELRVEALTRLGGAVRHLGDPAGSLRWLAEARALADSDLGRRGVPDGPLSYLWLQTAMTHRQLGAFGEAARAARRASQVARRARLRRELIKALGCEGLVAMSRGQVDRAIARYEESLAVELELDPERTARTRAYLIEAQGAAGRAEEVARHFEAARAELAGAPADAAERAWVHTSHAGALLALGRPADALATLSGEAIGACLEDAPLPGLTARRHLGRALCGVGETRRGFEVLAASPLVHGRALEPHLSFLAHLNVLVEAEARLAAGAWGPDIAGRARVALERVPRHDAVQALLGRALARFARSLDGRPSRRALATLLARCERVR